MVLEYEKSKIYRITVMESPFPRNWHLPITSLHCVGDEQIPLRFIRTIMLFGFSLMTLIISSDVLPSDTIALGIGLLTCEF